MYEIEVDTLYENMYPTSNIYEDKIKLLLTMRGYKRSDIHFRTNLDKQRSLRIAYWEPIQHDDLVYVKEHLKTHCNIQIKEWSVYDEDCGWLYNYDLFHIPSKKERNNNVRHSSKDKESL